MLSQEQVAKTFQRIGLGYDPEELPGVELMARIQLAFQTTVPYENLDIVRGIPLSLEPEDVYNKIVLRHRGGYCFEINGLLGQVYRALGYEVKDCFARYLRGETSLPMRRHRVLIVTAEGKRYVCDAGIGQSAFRVPLLLEEGAESRQYGEVYYMDRDPFLGWVISDLHQGAKRAFYSFTEEEQLNIDFTAASFWCEKSPASPFTRADSLSIKTAEGRKTVDGDKFRIFVGDVCTETVIEGPEERTRLYREVFGITL